MAKKLSFSGVKNTYYQKIVFSFRRGERAQKPTGGHKNAGAPDTFQKWKVVIRSCLYKCLHGGQSSTIATDSLVVESNASIFYSDWPCVRYMVDMQCHLRDGLPG